MKKNWLSKIECTGCGACYNICPKNAITMEKDSAGFNYPKINNNCIDCNACEIVCKNRGNEAKFHKKRPITYAAWSNCEAIRYHSTSGGLFSELAKEILAEGGFIAGAEYGTDMMVSHTVICDEKGLNKIRQSKYTQSDTNQVYKEVQKILKEGKTVVFCGTPCQVAALYAFLQKDYDNLITIDFICRGVNSPKAYSSWLKEIEEQEGFKATNVWFKYKEGGWKTSPQRTRIDFENGHYLILDGDTNLFMQGYLFSNLYIRPSCGKCEFKGLPRQGDITLADFWKIDISLDDDKGTSMVLINSQKGHNLFEKVKKNISCQERDFEEIFEGNMCFNESVMISKSSEKFLKNLDTGKFSEIFEKYAFEDNVVKKLLRTIQQRRKRKK